jgi:DHA2 family multidrug resistance protein-like MFS transporter
VTSSPAARAGRREWIGLAVIALPCLLYSMDLTVLNLAVPHLTADLKPTSTQLLWIVDIYGFMVAGALITMGTLGDRIGRRRLLLIGATVFGVASVIAAFSTSARMLIAARALLGIAGATLAPSTLSLIRTMFVDERQRTVAIGVWGTTFSVGGAIGPLLGGALLQYFWWGSVFLLAVPVMVLLLVLGPMLLPEYRDPNAGRPDLVSAALSVTGVLAVIFGLKRMAAQGLTAVSVVAIVAGLTIGVLFMRRQQTLADPLIDLKLFRSTAFSTALAVNVLGTFITFGSFLYTAQYFQLVLGLTPLRAGLWMLPSAGAVTLGSMLSPVIVRRFRPVSVIGASLLLVGTGFVVLTQVRGDSLATLVTGTAIFAVGLGPVFILTSALILNAAPPEHAGAASAISETGSEFGGALGIALLGSLGTAIYRSGVANRLPGGIPIEAREAARQTLGGAVAAASRLPEQLGTAVVDVGRDAFVRAFVVAAAVSAVIAVAMAILAMVVLRERAPAAAAS